MSSTVITDDGKDFISFVAKVAARKRPRVAEEKDADRTVRQKTSQPQEADQKQVVPPIAQAPIAQAPIAQAPIAQAPNLPAFALRPAIANRPPPIQIPPIIPVLTEAGKAIVEQIKQDEKNLELRKEEFYERFKNLVNGFLAAKLYTVDYYQLFNVITVEMPRSLSKDLLGSQVDYFALRFGVYIGAQTATSVAGGDRVVIRFKIRK
jgi:hypothetical protein